jgi:hypothetical protein
LKQSRLMSWLESLINIVVGFGISLAAQMFFLPLIGVAIAFHQNLIFALIMTVISLLRSFVLRRVFEALHIRRPLSPFMQAVIAERFRQVDVEGWDAAHDAKHNRGEMARAGAAYALWNSGYARGSVRDQIWPWELEWWKPTGFRRDLVKSCALIVAEGEKFDGSRKRSGA